MRRRSKPKTPAKRSEPTSGLMYWAARAVSELARVGSAMEPDPVHDLRVAIRRCRSMAEGLRTIDPGPGWKQFRSLPKPLFSTLGALRDTQVLQDWLSLLSGTDSVVAIRLQARVLEQKRSAHAALRQFESKRWLRLASELDLRARKLPPGSRVFLHLALERWGEAVHLHEVALRSRNPEDFHQLRIGIKRFRYTVENFMPEHHQRWGKDLKRMQDLLGDVHDLDVLLQEAGMEDQSTPGLEELVSHIHRERSQRLAEYEARTSGPESLWTVWREGLPSGRELSLAVNARLRHWARVVDPTPAQSRLVVQLSGRLWKALRRYLGWPAAPRTAAVLRAAALLHNVGSAKSRKKREPFRTRMIGRLSPPVGWNEEDMRLVRLVFRHSQGGAFAFNADEEYRSVPASQRKLVLQLTGILRLAAALAAVPSPPGLEVKTSKNVITLLVEGFDPTSEHASAIAEARHLLEYASGSAVLVRPAMSRLRDVPRARGAHG